MVKTILIILFVLAIVNIASLLFFKFSPIFGDKARGERKTRMLNSINYKKGKFHNLVLTELKVPFLKVLKASRDKGIERVPKFAIQNNEVIPENYFHTDSNKLSVTWLGHSSVIIEIEGKVILTDPVFSGRASLFSFVGPKEFEYQHPIRVENLPDPDVIIISHDHYDHLDFKTIKAIAPRTKLFITTLGVGAHLERWGVPSDKIIELDWWQEHSLSANLKFVATPSRHFSGRSPINRFSTLWASWVIQSTNKKLFFGADGGYSSVYTQIGEKYGPFDLTMLECGAYSPFWPEIHSFPEEVAQEQIDLKGKVLMPIHWAKFNLSIHHWREPIERLLANTEKLDLNVITPIIGEKLDLNSTIRTTKWWRE